MARILAVHRYFYPDAPPYASMLRKIVQRWSSDGHHVEVLSSQPSYRASRSPRRLPRIQRDGGVIVRRLDLPSESGRSAIVRLINAVRLGSAVLFRTVVGRYDVLMVSTAPPVILGATAALAARVSGTRLVYHCMDLHPEIGRLSGEFAHPRVFDFLMALDQITMRISDPAIVLSEDMAAAVERRPKSTGVDVVVRNNFALPVDERDSSDAKVVAARLWASLDLPAEAFVLLFAGNVGRFQGLEDALQAVALAKASRDIHMVLMGDGTAVPALRELSVRMDVADRVHFLGQQSVDVAREVMLFAHAGLVSLQPDVIKYAYPSKTATYAEQGMVLVVVVEPWSSLATEITGSGAGVVAAPGDVQGLARELSALAQQPDDVLERMSRAAVSVARRDFDEEVALQWWSELVKERT